MYNKLLLIDEAFAIHVNEKMDLWEDVWKNCCVFLPGEILISKTVRNFQSVKDLIICPLYEHILGMSIQSVIFSTLYVEMLFKLLITGHRGLVVKSA